MASVLGVPNQVVPFEYLVGGPLQAVVNAQRLMSQAILEFISEVGFDTKPGQPPEAKIFEFSFVHPVPDPQKPGEIIETPATMKVPVLSMIPPPNLSISDMTFDFNVKIVGFQNRSGQSKQPTTMPPLEMLGSYASRGDPTTGAEPHTFEILLKVAKEPSPEGTNKVLGMLNESVLSRPTQVAQTTPITPTSSPSPVGLRSPAKKQVTPRRKK